MTYTGAGGAPLTLSLNAPVTYTVTTNYTGTLFFVFDGVTGIGTGSFFTSGTGTLSYRVNNGAIITMDRLSRGLNGVDITPDDMYTFNTGQTTVAVGDTVTLFGGTITTVTNIPGTYTSGLYRTYLAGDEPYARISNNGVGNSVTVPESSSAALALPALGMMTVCLRNRRYTRGGSARS